ncbi:hypothetical protein ABPG75_013856 [Micractinium tetrahymenae]
MEMQCSSAMWGGGFDHPRPADGALPLAAAGGRLSNLNVRWPPAVCAPLIAVTMVATRSQVAREERSRHEWALYDAMLQGDASAVLDLLRSGINLAHVAPGGFSTLHCAVITGFPSLLSLLAAAGAPLDLALEEVQGEVDGPLAQLRHSPRLQSLSDPLGRLCQLRPGRTALAVACSWMVRCVPSARQLLRLGADPNAGAPDQTTLGVLTDRAGVYPGRRRLFKLADLLLRHGADVLGNHGQVLLNAATDCDDGAQELAATVLLPALERRRAAGTLRYHSMGQVFEVLRAAALHDQPALAQHSLMVLGTSLVHGYGAPTDDPARRAQHARFLSRLLFTVVSSGSLPILKALLFLHQHFPDALPFDWGHADRRGVDLLAQAATCLAGPDAAEGVRLLHAAGAPLKADALLQACNELAADGVEALLQCGRPMVDASMVQPAVRGLCRYSCPVHTTLVGLQWQSEHADGAAAAEPAALRILEALRAAGYRPTVWRDVVPPKCLRLGEEKVTRLDPFDHYSPDLSPRALLVARGGTWGPATRHLWPDGYYRSARTLLLALHRTYKTGRGAAGGAGIGSTGCSDCRHDEAGCGSRDPSDGGSSTDGRPAASGSIGGHTCIGSNCGGGDDLSSTGDSEASSINNEVGAGGSGWARLLAALPKDLVPGVIQQAANTMSAWL